MTNAQIEMVNINDLVPQAHPYRKLKALINFDKIVKSVVLPRVRAMQELMGMGRAD